MISAVLLLLAQVIPPPFAQITDLATNHDGAELYFGSGLIHAETSTEPHSKIFRWTRETGVRTFLSRTREWTTPCCRWGVLSNYFDLRFPSVAANGLVAFSGYRFCKSCFIVGPPVDGMSYVMTSDGTVTREIKAPLPISRAPSYYTVFSPNGLYFSVGGSSYYSEPRAAVVNLGLTAKRSVVADDGTAVYADANYRLAAAGRYDADTGRSTRQQLLPASVPVAAPMISGNAKVVVYESLYEQGTPRRFYSLDLETRQERLLFTDAETEDYGPLSYLNDRPTNFLVPFPEAMYGASIDDTGRFALLLAREAVDKPRQWLYLAPTDRGEGGGEWFAYAEEGYREALLSGDAQVIFAVTNSGRLIRINRQGNVIEDLVPPTPFINNIVGGVRPGSLVRIYGGGFATETIVPQTLPATTSLAGVEVEFQGRPTFITRVSPNEIDVQLPWDFNLKPTGQWEQSPLLVKVPNSSPLQFGAVQWPYSTDTINLPPGPFHDDGTPVTLARRVRSNEILRFVVSGMPLPPGVPGMPAVQRQPVDFNCVLNSNYQPIQTLYAGPISGTFGLSEVVVKMPEFTDANLDPTRRRASFRCIGEGSTTFFMSLPVERR
ncbi:MAG: hypothetical protein K1Y02_26255 [Candidatus Hydrogenedentes bacterium]|nr:hypothetical protein [Candidatus Hydrogenedentota bacterium]